jgi:hypothetical protein
MVMHGSSFNFQKASYFLARLLLGSEQLLELCVGFDDHGPELPALEIRPSRPTRLCA